MQPLLAVTALLLGLVSTQNVLSTPQKYSGLDETHDLMQQLQEAQSMLDQLKKLESLQVLEGLQTSDEEMQKALMNLESGPVLDLLPTDAVENLKWAMFNFAWMAANIRRNNGDARHNEDEYKIHWRDFKHKMATWLDDDFLNPLHKMFTGIAWYAVNHRNNHPHDAINDMKKFHEGSQEMVGSKQISLELQQKIIYMAGGAAWNAANEASWLGQDPRPDYERWENSAAAMSAVVKIKDMRFKMDQVQIGTVTPVDAGYERLENHSDIEQEMIFEFSKQLGTTMSTTTTINFSNSFTHTTKVNTPGIGEFSFSVQIGFERGHSWSEDISQVITKKYTYPLKVPAHSIYEAKAIIQEADLHIPYELKFDFNGQTVTRTGVWHGVSSSKTIYSVKKVGTC